jgi:predicted anti-sigma-YlaC factor YlaD
MNCELYQEYISQFIDGELQSADESNLFQHLGYCEQCRMFLKNILSLRTTLTRSQQVVVPNTLDQQILKQPALTAKQSAPQNLIWHMRKTQYSFRVIGLAIILSVATSIFVSSLWFTSQQPQQTIVCLTPLPEVEVAGYVVIGHPPIKGHQQ